jgi:hypothetical protein
MYGASGFMFTNFCFLLKPGLILAVTDLLLKIICKTCTQFYKLIFRYEISSYVSIFLSVNDDAVALLLFVTGALCWTHRVAETRSNATVLSHKRRTID